jgi:adenine-specific DNA-methyltransferase
MEELINSVVAILLTPFRIIFKLIQYLLRAFYLLSILNSKLISYLKTKSSTAAKKDDFTQLTLNDIREIKVSDLNLVEQISFIQLVEQILTAKNENPKADTLQLENDIDQLVYKLYDLTPEEIKIIEASNQ